MEPRPDFATALPALRAITNIEPGPEAQTWILTINRTRFRALRITVEGLARLFQGLGAEILEERPTSLVVRLETNQPFYDFLEGRRQELLRLYRPRHLTPGEIEEIVTVIPRVYSPVKEIADYAREEILDRVREQLADEIITPLGFPDLKDTIIYHFERARVEPGETVGLTVAEALSALTQAALNAFHQSGARSNVAAGIELLQDLLSASPERKVELCTVHFWDKDLTFEDVFNKRVDLVAVPVGSTREERNSLEGIVLDYAIDNPANFEPYWWVTLFPQLTGKSLPKTSSVVRLTLNKARMVAHQITMQDVATAIQKYNTPDIVTLVPGPLDSGMMFVYPDENLVVEPLIAKKIPVMENVAETFLSDIFLPVLSKILIKGIPGIRNITPNSFSTWDVVESEIKAVDDEFLAGVDDPEERTRLDRSWTLHLSSFVMTRTGITVEKLATLLLSLDFEILEQEEFYLTVIAPGEEPPGTYVNSRVELANETVEQRRKARLIAQRERHRAQRQGTQLPEVPVEVKDKSEEVVRNSRYTYAQTQGTNLPALYARRDVDTRRTISNNPNTVLRLFGIEASRNLLIQEFIFILESANLELDPRHIILLADFMTNRGMLLPISFWGVVRSSPGPLTVGSVAKAINTFRTGAAFGQSEKVQTTASSMYLGQRGKFGSGYVDLKIDEARLKEYQETIERQEAVKVSELEEAIERLDNITFGAEAEATGLDPLAELVALTVDPAPPLTQIGQGTIAPPLELVRTAPLVSPLVEKGLDLLPPVETLPTPELVVTVEETPAPIKRRIIPRPTPRPIGTGTPLIRRPGTTQPVPKARIGDKH